MPDPTDLARLAPLVRRDADPATAQRDLTAIHRRIRRRRARTTALLACLLVGAVVWFTRTDERPPHMQLADGSRVHALSADFDLRVRSTHATTRFELAAGAGRFEVADDAEMELHIAAIRLSARDGATFEARRGADAAQIDVVAGAVDLQDGDAVVPLTGRHRLPMGPSTPAARPPSAAPTTRAAAPRQPAPAPPNVAPRQVGSVRSAAPASVVQRATRPRPVQPSATRRATRPRPAQPGTAQPPAAQPPPAPVVTAASLMGAADAARLRGAQPEAIAHLETLVRRFSTHPEAPLAVFTLGRLHRAPADAARAFERYVALAPAGPLALDALTRAALKWQAAGDLPRAKRLARQVAERAPAGRHVRRLEALLAP